MRLISQDETKEVPYEACSVFTDELQFRAHVGVTTFVMGDYIASAQIDTIWRDIRRAAVSGKKYYRFPDSRRV